MADLSLTAFTFTDKTSLHPCTAGEAITKGEAVYIDASDNRARLAKASGSKAQAHAVGLAASTMAAGDQGHYATGTIDTTGLTEGLAYVLSGTAGDLSPHTDATTPASTEYLTIMGGAETTTRFHINPTPTGGQVA